VGNLPYIQYIKVDAAESPLAVMDSYFDGAVDALYEARWMSKRSLYALQSIVILVSPAHHLNKGDLYFTLLATAIRCGHYVGCATWSSNEQNRTIDEYAPIAIFRGYFGERNNGFGGGREGAEKARLGTSGHARLVIQQEHHARYGQIDQVDWFHLAFNGTNGEASINRLLKIAIHAHQCVVNKPSSRLEHQQDAQANSIESNNVTTTHIWHLLDCKLSPRRWLTSSGRNCVSVRDCFMARSPCLQCRLYSSITPGEKPGYEMVKRANAEINGRLDQMPVSPDFPPRSSSDVQHPPEVQFRTLMVSATGWVT